MKALKFAALVIASFIGLSQKLHLTSMMIRLVTEDSTTQLVHTAPIKLSPIGHVAYLANIMRVSPM